MPKATPSPLPVCGRDLENLRASGLTETTIRANGLRTRDGALEFPYRDLRGNVNCFCRRRPHKPSVIDGKPAKYVQPKGSGPRAYFPVASLRLLRDGRSPVYITEGEKKALALAQLGLAAVGIGGVWCGCKKDSAELIDDLAAVPWEGRAVYIVFDYDAKPQTRRDVEAARTRLARGLKAARGGDIYNVELPPGAGGAKQGIDDFLTARGEGGPTAFRGLVPKAILVIPIIPAAAGLPGILAIKIIPPALGEAAYHGPIGRFLRDLAPHTEATDAGVLAHLLPALGTLIGPGPALWAGTRQAARVNTVLCGPTSTGRKGTALAPVDELMRMVDGDFWNEQRVGGLSTGEGLVSKVSDPKVWDKELGEYVDAGRPAEKRLYVVEEEFSKVLAQLRRDGNILSQILRESYDSGNLSVMTRSNPLQAFGAHIAITGHITPEELHDRFNHVEMANGFGNRFLWFAVKSDKVIGRPAPIPDEVYLQFKPHVKAVARYPSVDVPLADASLGRWEKEMYPALREDKPGLAGALVARGASMVLRLALIYYLLDSPPRRKPGLLGRRCPPEIARIQPVHLDAALAVWDYCVASVEILFRTKAGTFLGDKILGLLDAGPMTKDVLNDHLSPKQKAEAGGVLAGLEAAGLVRKAIAKKPGAGRPATLWELVK
jgi:hypothetical protein